MSRGKLKTLEKRLAKALLEWCENQLSMAGWEVKIKAITQALPVYIISVFKVPAGLCEELTKMIRRLWWGAKKGKRKTHWVGWDIMLRPKDRGGIGFKDLRLFNQSLLARQARRLIQYPDSLCTQVLQAQYYPQGDITDTVFIGNGSTSWQAIEHGLEQLKQGYIWRVGDGSSIRVWRDPWIPRGSSFRPITPKRRCRLKWVADFMQTDGSWNITLLRQHFFASSN